ncbi:MAG: permease, partial [Eubacteriales bacterium]|nr:permease [Eubacteriales bacterium]
MNTDNKLTQVFKSNRLLLIVAAVYLAVLVTSPEMAFKSMSNSMYYLKEMLIIMPVIFLLTVVIEALVPRDVIVRSFGEKSGVKGNILALILGSISAGPVYAAFPVSKMLLAKGASIGNIVIVLSAWAVVKLPMLANEARFLGVNFMVVRWILTVVAIFIMALVVGKAVKKKDLPAEPELMTGKSPA